MKGFPATYFFQMAIGQIRPLKKNGCTPAGSAHGPDLHGRVLSSNPDSQTSTLACSPQKDGHTLNRVLRAPNKGGHRKLFWSVGFFELPTYADTKTFPAGGLCVFSSIKPKVRNDRPLQKELISDRLKDCPLRSTSTAS